MKNLALALAVVAAVISFISLGNNLGVFKMNKSYSHSNDVSTTDSSNDVSTTKSLKDFDPGKKGFELGPSNSEGIDFIEDFVPGKVTSMEALFENASEDTSIETDARKNMQMFLLRYDKEGGPYSLYNLDLIYKLANNISIK